MNGHVHDLRLLFLDSAGLPLAQSVWKCSFLSSFFFWAFENCSSSDGALYTGTALYTCVSACFPIMSKCMGLQHIFTFYLLNQMPTYGFQVSRNHLVCLQSPFWVWARVPLCSPWCSLCVDSGVPFLKYATWSYKYRLQSCQRPHNAVWVLL